MTMIDTSDSRFPKAVAIADQAGQWLKLSRCRWSQSLWRPSQRTPGRYYLTTQSSCTCEDAKRQASPICKHALAVQIHCARVAGTPMPASAVVDGLTQMVIDRHPVLDMVREADGSIRWERHAHANGAASYMPRRPVALTAPVAPLAPMSPARPDIFTRFDGD